MTKGGAAAAVTAMTPVMTVNKNRFGRTTAVFAFIAVTVIGIGDC